MIGLIVIDDDPEVAQGEILWHLEGIVRSNQWLLLRHRVPPLYSSGVAYRPEPWAARAQSFSKLSECLMRGWAECKALAAWRCAEARNADPDRADEYRLHLSRRDYAAGQRPPGYRELQPRAGRTRLWHVQLQLPDGSLEDPSTKVRLWET